jgi:hypothetical protein
MDDGLLVNLTGDGRPSYLLVLALLLYIVWIIMIADGHRSP